FEAMIKQAWQPRPQAEQISEKFLTEGKQHATRVAARRELEGGGGVFFKALGDVGWHAARHQVDDFVEKCVAGFQIAGRRTAEWEDFLELIKDEDWPHPPAALVEETGVSSVEPFP